MRAVRQPALARARVAPLPFVCAAVSRGCVVLAPRAAYECAAAFSQLVVEMWLVQGVGRLLTISASSKEPIAGPVSLASQIANPNLVISRTCPPPNLQTCADAYVAAGTHPDRSTQSNKTRFQHQNAAHTNAARELVERLPASADRLRDPYFTAATSSRRRGNVGKRRAPPRRHKTPSTRRDAKRLKKQRAPWSAPSRSSATATLW